MYSARSIVLHTDVSLPLLELYVVGYECAGMATAPIFRINTYKLSLHRVFSNFRCSSLNISRSVCPLNAAVVVVFANKCRKHDRK